MVRESPSAMSSTEPPSKVQHMLYVGYPLLLGVWVPEAHSTLYVVDSLSLSLSPSPLCPSAHRQILPCCFSNLNSVGLCYLFTGSFYLGSLHPEEGSKQRLALSLLNVPEQPNL